MGKRVSFAHYKRMEAHIHAVILDSLHLLGRKHGFPFSLSLHQLLHLLFMKHSDFFWPLLPVVAVLSIRLNQILIV